MADPEVQKVWDLLKAARQRLGLANDRLGDSFRSSMFRAREHSVAADELLAEAQKVLRTARP